MNYALFLVLNAPARPNGTTLAIATFFAEYVVWLIPIVIGIGWLRGGENRRKSLLEATASGLAGLIANQLIGLFWQHPRPFAVGLGHTFVAHVADSSFPSDHLTLFWAVSFSFLLHSGQRRASLALTVLGIPVAWARVYVGVHFPIDMLGSILVAALSAWLAFRETRWFMAPVFRVAICIHQRIFSRLIERGLVRP